MGFENGMSTELSMWIEQAGGDFVDEQKEKCYLIQRLVYMH